MTLLYPRQMSQSLLGHKLNSMKHISLFFALFFVFNIAFAEEKKTLKDERKVLNVLDMYMKEVDNKNSRGMLKHLSMPFVLHFNSEQAVNVTNKEEFGSLFERWEKSDNSNFHSTKLESVEVKEVFSNFMCVADVIYSRIDQAGEEIRRERALYYFIKGERFNPILFLFKWWKRWRIYMITNIELSEE